MKKRKGLSLHRHSESNLLMYQLYDTVVLSMNNVYFKLNTGGFKTNHTKNCMNDNLPEGYRVFQKDFEWYVETPEKVLNFEDDMVLTL